MTKTIFRDYDRKTLDAQYNNRERVADYLQYFERWAAASAATRQALQCRLDVAFGKTAAERMDIFPAEQPGAPACMFIHGGYWQSMDKGDCHFLARGLVPHGVTVIINNYGLCPHVSMDEITRQNRAAVAWLWDNAHSVGIRRERIHVSGHSAGGHLVAMLMATDWPAFHPGAPTDLVTSGCAISGLYDLEPIRHCYLNEILGMHADEAARNTPLLMHYPIATPLLISHGGSESPEYYRQSEEMRVLWEGLDYPVECVIADGRNHFSLLDEFADPHSELTLKQLALMS